MEHEELKNGCIFPLGKRFESDLFTGEVYIYDLSEMKDNKTPSGYVTFAPHTINNWHKHPGGQILYVIGGEGYYQEWGKKARLLHAGDVVVIPPNVKHWHGATHTSWFSHIFLDCQAQLGDAVWLEKVSQEAYDKLK
jgi:quercetin dioxygenase-like cupin family protein